MATPLRRRDFAEAHAWLSMCHLFAWMHQGESEERRRMALSEARKAVELDPEDAVAHATLAYVLVFDANFERAAAEFTRALEIDPNYADAWVFRGEFDLARGRPEEGLGHILTAFRLNPYPPGWYYWELGFLQYGLRRYEEAVASLMNEGTYAGGSKRILAASLAQLGRIDEAKAEAAAFLVKSPSFSALAWGKSQPFANEADRQHFVDGYLKAGLPP
jgi:tetratricopeptide (TPR) repeat protein